MREREKERRGRDSERETEREKGEEGVREQEKEKGEKTERTTGRRYVDSHILTRFLAPTVRATSFCFLRFSLVLVTPSHTGKQF